MTNSTTANFRPETLANFAKMLSDYELENAVLKSHNRAVALADALTAVKTAIEPGADDEDALIAAASTVSSSLIAANTNRDILARERSDRKSAAIADAMANPDRYPTRVIVFRHGRAPGGGFGHKTKVRLVDYDRGRGYAEVLDAHGEWFMVGDIHHVEDLDGKYI